ncbi:MAG: hypothetical protein ISN26_07690, partial [Betaproteobacteria bacterium AqS2]|nr:hypothetical protein [Betaproteobacteria bacterium AqS2]
MKRTAARIAAFVLACAGFAAAPAPSSAQLCQVFEGVYTGSKELANCGAEVNHTAAVTIELIDDSGLFQLNNSATPTTAPVTATTFAERNNAGNSRYRLYTRPLASIALDGGSASTLTNNFYLVTFKQHFATVTTDVEMTVLRTGLLPELDCEGGINAGTYEAGNAIDGCGFRILTNTPDAAAVTGTIAAPLAFPTRTDLLLIPGPAGASFQAMADATFNVGVHTLTIASLLEGGLLGRQDELPVTVYDYINDFEANFFRNVVSGTVTIGVDYNCTYTEHDANAPTITLVETIEASTVTVINSTAVITVTRQTVRQGIARETNCRTRPVRTYRNVSTVVMSVINGTNVTFTTQVAEKLALPTDRQVTLSIVNQTDLFSFAGGGRTLVSSFVSTLAPGIRVRRDRTYNYHGTRRYSITVAQYSGGARLRDFVMFMELVNQPPLLRDRPETLWTSAYVARSGNTFVLPAPTDHVLFDDIEGTTLSYAASVVSPAGGASWLAGGTRSLSGDPPAAGTYVFDLWASDGTDTAAEAFRFTVTVNNTAPELIAFEMSGRQTLEIREGVDIGGEGVGIGFPSKFTGGVRVIGGDRLPFTVARDGSAYTLKIKQGPAVVVTGTVVATSTGPVSVDYETNPAYTLTIQALINAQANTYAVGTVTLSVTNVSDEPARIMVSGRALEFNEGYIGVGEYIDTGYRITVTDADAPDFGHEEYSFSVPALTLEGGRLLATGPGALDYEAGHRIVTMVVRDRQAYNAAGDRAAATAVIALSLKAANEGAIRVVKNPPVIEVQDSQTVSFPHTAFAVGEDLKLRNTRFPGNVVVDFSSFSKPYLKVFAFNFGPNIRDRRYTLFYEHKHGTIIVEGPVRMLGTTHVNDLPRPSATFRGGPGRLPLTITEPTYLFDRDAVSWHGMGQVIAEGDALVGTDKDGVTVQIPRGLYNQHLMNVVSDDRFEVDYGDLLGAGTEQRFRGIYAKPGAVFDGKPLPITVQVRSGVPPRMFLDEHMLFTLKLSNFLVPNPRNAYSHYPNLRFRSVAQHSKIELTLTLFAPGVAIEGAQAALGAQAGIVDTGLTLVARNYADETRSDELRFVSSSPAIVLPDGYTGQRRVPILMDAGLAAASEALTRDHCGALALPVTLHAEIENVRSNAAVASIRITPGPARLRGRAAATLSAGIAAVTAPTGYELDCLASDVEASFTDSRFTLESGSGATRRIMLKAGATIAAGEGEAVVTVSHRQGGGAQIGQSVLRLPVAATSPELRAGPPYVPGRYYEDDLFMLRLGQLFTGGRGDVSYEVSFTPTVGYKQVAGGVLRASLDYDVPLEGERIIDYNANPIRFVNVTISAWPYVITVVARDQGGGQATASFTLTANAPTRHNTSPPTRVPR